MTYARMQKPDLAFEWLEKAFRNHEVEMVWLKQEPDFQPIHDDPRLQKMLHKAGFPE